VLIDTGTWRGAQPEGGRPSVASATFDLVSAHPYRFGHFDEIFTV